MKKQFYNDGNVDFNKQQAQNDIRLDNLSDFIEAADDLAIDGTLASQADSLAEDGGAADDLAIDGTLASQADGLAEDGGAAEKAFANPADDSAAVFDSGSGFDGASAADGENPQTHSTDGESSQAYSTDRESSQTHSTDGENPQTHSTDGDDARRQNALKTVLIIGASDGIGQKTAEIFIEKGYRVYNASRTPSALGGIVNITLDAADDISIQKAVNEIIAERQSVDIFVYSAGFSMSAPVESAIEQDYRYLFDVNFFAFAKAVQLIIPHMRSNGGGRIIAVSSMGGLFPIVFDSFYSASKAALNMFIKSIAIELEPYGIRVTSVMPGGTATGFTRKRKVYPPELTGDYEARLMKANAILADIEQNGMPPQRVAADIAAIAESPLPPIIHAVGIKNKILAAADKILPDSLNSMLVKNKYKQNAPKIKN
ncbi:MAG: SDR family NAD(P)-dependent oxidoreductase [Clostridiales bacterium]|jgi:short-subunit dehydrogenase|nr:SDR family NAD(P)-dependent oxidoreductase [Clostridiales bacterium]